MSRRAVFRADASPTIGGGHVMRCLALAGVLGEAGWACGFAVGPHTTASVPALESSGHDILVLNGNGDAALAECWAERWGEGWGEGADLLVADHYGLGGAFETECRRWSRRVLVIDDLADRAHDCDLLVDQTLGRQAADYAGLLPAACETLLGPRFALLRPQFAAARADSLKRRTGADRLGRILVSLGGTDPHGVALTALKGIDLAGIDVAVDVVAGADGRAKDAVRDAVSGLGCPVTVHGQVDDMAALMAAADLSIGAAGVTSWERCCLGLPSLLIITADNQRAIAAALAQGGAAEVIGWHAEVGAEDIAGAVGRLHARPEALSAMAARAARVCDGRGALRVRERLA